MDLLTIILFFVYIFGLGYSATRILKKEGESDNFLERNIMRMGIGLGILPILGILLNLLHIPLDWKIFLALSLLPAIYFAFFKKDKEAKKEKFKLTKSDIYIFIVLILFALTLFMYLKGAFVYPYLEDDDPWVHAISAEYISLEKTVYQSSTLPFFVFMDPYPPGYTLIMGILHQTSASLLWILKFFNALIIAMGIMFFYFFVKEFTKDRRIALFATFMLAAIPCFLTHFIWATSLAVILFFVAFYCIFKIEDDCRWKYIAAPVIASILVTQPSHAFNFGILFLLYFAGKSVANKKFETSIFLSGLFGLVLSFAWWGAMLARRGLSGILMGTGYSGVSSGISEIFSPGGGTATRAYNFADYFIAQSQNMINNPVGIGIILCFLAIFGMMFILLNYKSLFHKENSWKLILVFWFIFTFLGVNSQTFHLPIGLYAFRFWMLLAIPVSILAAEGGIVLSNSLEKLGIPKLIILMLLIGGIIWTSAYPKYIINTSMWNAGANIGYNINDYLWFKQLPSDTGVFGFNINGVYVLGMDKKSCEWCPEIIDYRKEIISKPASEIYEWLKNKDYQYTFIESKFAQDNGVNETNKLIQEMVSSEYFDIKYQSNSMVVFKVM